MEKTKLLFVCLGNICRSPSAENIMNHLIEKKGLTEQFECDSAGTSNYHIGSSPDRRMKEAARKRGIELRGKARQIEEFDLEYYDLILAMDKSNYHNILALDPKGKYKHKVKLMCDFAKNFTDQEVPDPYYGGESGFNYVIDLLLDACQGLLDYCQEKMVKG
ncbi:low molecular weight protein-tyrosine-phosphatase [Cyanobacterium sp. Dongsha4]|uniref:low molecular weight protein-tyrosine-phosphatase n=1 Tax=Cyanobacterium sp. DS4 TaxID=2878255 RepID=UPI002E81F8ED|nr:low molecular weight protein-tyrosine-phosphatase [Cyanobacterium sp. Dongsha4]WVL01210.1 low molecular weight phosphotyrosine protein phosphatase [Cyanobacterium sp. Dongsha4]